MADFAGVVAAGLGIRSVRCCVADAVESGALASAEAVLEPLSPAACWPAEESGADESDESEAGSA